VGIALLSPDAAGAVVDRDLFVEALASLDPHQRLATTAPPGPLLVVAGAGAGKTRVLTHRAAWMVARGGFDASEVLAVTFTNKAAQEMADRLQRLLGDVAGEMTIGTIHSICHRMIRPYAERLQRSGAFSILTERDSYRLLDIARSDAGGILTRELSPATLYGHISMSKALYYTPARLRGLKRDLHREVADIWDRYKELCRESDALDFSDLIVAATWLLGQEDGVRALFQRRYQAILVDECQDLTKIEREWIKRLAAPEFNLTLVGDDDQTVFAWRGARSAFMLDFEHEFAGADVVVLPLNYRSGTEVVRHAKRLIDHEPQRIAKDLRSARPEPGTVRITEYANEWEEAHAVARAISELQEDRHVGLGDVAILMRGNSYMSPIEQALSESRIPYELLRGTKFWDRAEIRDALAFAQLAANARHRVAFERVIRRWRGIGDETAALIAAHVAANGLTFLQGLYRAGTIEGISPRYAESAEALAKRVSVIRSQGRSGHLVDAIRLCVDSTNHEERLRKRSDHGSVESLRRLRELGDQAERFVEHDPTGDLMVFLSELSLARASSISTRTGAVSVGTIHSAKGLEWTYTFVLGTIEGELPAGKALTEGDLSGERRVMYVAMTRAGSELNVFFPAQHRGRPARPSRFIAEALEDLADADD
jgi:DNA helicase-2/ATP-dependent DNA helicase PcrA